MDRNPPPWIKTFPDPDPPTPSMMGGALREKAPSVHEEVASLATRYPVVQQDAALWGTIWQLFHTIVEWLPEEVVVDLSPTPDLVDPDLERGAVQLLTRSQRWQPRVPKPRKSFAWPHQEVYEFSDSLLPRSRPNLSDELREAAEAAYRLFVRVAVALAQLFEHCRADPATIRRLRYRAG